MEKCSNSTSGFTPKANGSHEHRTNRRHAAEVALTLQPSRVDVQALAAGMGKHQGPPGGSGHEF